MTEVAEPSSHLQTACTSATGPPARISSTGAIPSRGPGTIVKPE